MEAREVHDQRRRDDHRDPDRRSSGRRPQYGDTTGNDQSGGDRGKAALDRRVPQRSAPPAPQPDAAINEQRGREIERDRRGQSARQAAAFQPISAESIVPGPGAAREIANKSANSRCVVQPWTVTDWCSISARRAVPPPSENSESGTKTNTSASRVLMSSGIAATPRQ